MFVSILKKSMRKKSLIIILIAILFTFTFLFSKNSNIDSLLSKSSASASNSSNAFAMKELDFDVKISNKRTLQYEVASDYELTESMKNYFDKIAEFLKTNPEVSILITAYSDAESNYEQKLYRSQKRAKNAADYLISKGIDEKRVIYSAKNPLPMNKINEQEIESKKLPIIEIQFLR